MQPAPQPQAQPAPQPAPAQTNMNFVDPMVPAPVVLQPPTAKQIQSALKLERLLVGKTFVALNLVRKFYSTRNYQPVFIDQNGPTALAQQLKAMIDQSVNRGLNRSHYWVAEIDQRWVPQDQRQLIELDLLLTQAFVRFASDASTGRLNPKVDILPEINFTKGTFSAFEYINELVSYGYDLDAGIANLEPQAPEYKALKDAAARFAALQAAGGFAQLAITQKGALKPGAKDPSVPAIRTRLVDLGYLPENERANPSITFDPVMVQAIKTLQVNTKQAFAVDKVADVVEEKQVPPELQAKSRADVRPFANQIKAADGTIGPRVLAELNKSPQERISAIGVNLEKWRWLPRDFGSRYIVVNTARQELQVHEGDQIPVEMNVVVGRLVRRSPSMITSINGLVINPDWTAPVRNIVQDIIPAMLRDPGHVKSESLRITDLRTGMRVDNPMSIDWSVYNDTNPPPYRFTQESGLLSALGAVKFVLKNSPAVYMHDWAFDQDHIGKFYRDDRLASSGCIRLSRPRALLDYVLRDFSGADANEVMNKISNTKDKPRFEIPTPSEIPVIVANLTVSFDKNGLLQFSPDYYGQDELIAQALQ
jgi:murein L,D-transpeptidase YcbB/YkuD